MVRNTRTLLLSLLLILLGASFALCASVTVVPSGGGNFSVQGSAMDGVSGIDLTLTYDTSSLGSPTVTQGSLVSGALLAANTTVSGAIKIAIISSSPFSGSGEIAKIRFATQSGSGGITSVRTSMIDSSGAAIASQAGGSGGDSLAGGGLSTTPGVPFSQPTTTPPSPGTTTRATTSTMPTYPGTVTMPSDIQAKTETKPAETTEVPAQISEPAAVKPVQPPAEDKPAPEPQKPEKVKITSYKGTLENFRAFKGEKSPATLIALIGKQIAPTIRQEPTVAMSDGKTTVKIVAEMERTGNKSPNFALNGAKLVSLNKDASSFTWVIEAMPQTGAVQAGLTILTDSDTIEYPLTVAPLIEGFSPTEADFIAFLKDSKAAAPKRDLNGDGKHDYLDDFIYTANYVMKKGTSDKAKKK